MAYDIHKEAFATLNSIRVPRVMPVIGWILAVAGILIGLFMAFVPWVQTASGFGLVTALNPNDRLQEINVLVSGRVEEWYVQDGSRVSVGDPIVRIIDNDPQLLDRLAAQRAQVEAKLDADRNAVDLAQIDMERMKRLHGDGLAAKRDYEQARLRLEELRARMAETTAELSRMDVNLSRQSVQIVRAPRDGVIQEIFTGAVANFVSAGQAVATFVPDNTVRAVELFVDGRDVALVRLGAEVRLQFEGWPVIQVSGWPSIAVGTFSGEVVAIDPSADANGRFRVLVSEDAAAEHPWPDRAYVRFGAKVRGWVLLDTVSTGYEVWRQLNNFPPNLPGLETGS